MQQKLKSEDFSHQSDSSTGRIDELERYYKPIEILDNWDHWVFWLSIILSIVVFFKASIPWPLLQSSVEVLFIVSVVIHVTLSLYVRFHLFPLAERKRRRQLLSDSFSVPLISETTQKYYNNEISPSVARLGANVLENTLFAKNICLRMAVKERKQILVYFTAWIMALSFRSTDLGLLVIITQTLLSSEIIENWIRIELLRHETENFYDELYSQFLHKVDLSTMHGVASILDTFSAYEAIKSMTGIRQLRSIFFEINPELSKEWDKTRQKLEIDVYEK